VGYYLNTKMHALGPCGAGVGDFADSKPHIRYAGSPFTWTKDVAISAANVTNYSGRVTSYAAVSLPAGVVCHATTGQLTGTPTAAGNGTGTVTATGPSGLTGTASVAWTVNP
jgi:hypothetical protein